MWHLMSPSDRSCSLLIREKPKEARIPRSCARLKANIQAGKAGRLAGNNEPETLEEFNPQWLSKSSGCFNQLDETVIKVK